MKRDWQEIKQILEDVESDVSRIKRTDTLKGDEKRRYEYLLHCLHESRLIDPCGMVLTMKGYDLLDAMRSKKVWGEVANVAMQNNIPISLELIEAVCASIIQRSVGAGQK